VEVGPEGADPVQSGPAETPADPPVENPIREVADDPDSQQAIPDDPDLDAVFADSPEVFIEGLFSAWVDDRVLDLLFPGNRFQHGPEFLDGGPNTLYRICVDDGTPEYICRQRYAP
jgi:hypothetical protein